MTDFDDLEAMLNDDYSNEYVTTTPESAPVNKVEALKVVETPAPVTVTTVTDHVSGASDDLDDLLNDCTVETSPVVVETPVESVIDNSETVKIIGDTIEADEISVEETINEVEEITPITEVIKPAKKKRAKKKKVVPVSSFNEPKNEVVKPFDFKDVAGIELYKGDTKMEGYHIIKNNDFMQYHYFAQEYSVIKRASALALVYIVHNGIKNYIGFFSISSPTLEKVIRNQMYGTHFLLNMYKYKRNNEHLANIKTFNVSRVVILPSFRGLGLIKHLQDLLLTELSKDSDMMYLEISSAMLHSFDFIHTRWNKSLIGADMKLFESPNFKGTKYLKGFKARTEYVATTASYIFERPEYIQLMVDYFKDFFEVKISYDDMKEKMNQSVNTYDYELDDIFELKKLRVPLILLNFMSMEEAKLIKFNNDFTGEKWTKLDKTQIKKPKKEKAA